MKGQCRIKCWQNKWGNCWREISKKRVVACSSATTIHYSQSSWELAASSRTRPIRSASIRQKLKFDFARDVGDELDDFRTTVAANEKGRPLHFRSRDFSGVKAALKPAKAHTTTPSFFLLPPES
jgi:hypothetical protein